MDQADAARSSAEVPENPSVSLAADGLLPLRLLHQAVYGVGTRIQDRLEKQRLHLERVLQPQRSDPATVGTSQKTQTAPLQLGERRELATRAAGRCGVAFMDAQRPRG